MHFLVTKPRDLPGPVLAANTAFRDPCESFAWNHKILACFCVRVARFLAKDLHEFAKRNFTKSKSSTKKWNPFCKCLGTTRCFCFVCFVCLTTLSLAPVSVRYHCGTGRFFLDTLSRPASSKSRSADAFLGLLPHVMAAPKGRKCTQAMCWQHLQVRFAAL